MAAAHVDRSVDPAIETVVNKLDSLFTLNNKRLHLKHLLTRERALLYFQLDFFVAQSCIPRLPRCRPTQSRPVAD